MKGEIVFKNGATANRMSNGMLRIVTGPVKGFKKQTGGWKPRSEEQKLKSQAECDNKGFFRFDEHYWHNFKDMTRDHASYSDMSAVKWVKYMFDEELGLESDRRYSPEVIEQAKNEILKVARKIQ